MLSRSTLCLLSAAAALQAPPNAHIAITGPAPLAKAVGAKCVEAGAPRDLVQLPDGWFSALVDSTSPATAAALRRAALASSS